MGVFSFAMLASGATSPCWLAQTFTCTCYLSCLQAHRAETRCTLCACKHAIHPAEPKFEFEFALLQVDVFSFSMLAYELLTRTLLSPDTSHPPGTALGREIANKGDGERALAHLTKVCV